MKTQFNTDKAKERKEKKKEKKENAPLVSSRHFVLSVKLIYLKGVLHPRPILGLFLHLSKKLQHIYDKQELFFVGYILRNLATVLGFH